MFAQKKKHTQGKNFKTKIRYDLFFFFFAYIDMKVYRVMDQKNKYFK